MQECNLALTVVAVLSQQGKQESKITKILFLSLHLVTVSEYLSWQSKPAKSQTGFLRIKLQFDYCNLILARCFKSQVESSQLMASQSFSCLNVLFDFII